MGIGVNVSVIIMFFFMCKDVKIVFVIFNDNDVAVIIILLKVCLYQYCVFLFTDSHMIKTSAHLNNEREIFLSLWIRILHNIA